MSEDVIQRPKGRRNNSIDLSPSNHEEPVKEKKSFSFGKKESATVETGQEDTSSKKPSISFGRRTTEPSGTRDQEPVSRKPSISFGKKKTEEPAASHDVEFETRRSEPIVKQREPVQEPVRTTAPQQTPERKSFSASINMGQTQGQTHSQQRSMDLGETTRPRTEGTGSMETTTVQPKTQSHGTIDTGAQRTSQQKPGIDMGTSGTSTATTSKKRSALGGIGAALPFGKKEEEDRKGTWGNTGYSATDDQAHRNTKYRIPSFMKQTMIVFMVQMKLFSKMKWTYFMLFVALLIPIIYFAGGNILSTMMTGFGFQSEYSNTYISGLLSFLPILLGLFTSVLCGTQLPNEFKERTAYMNVSLPLDRRSFYLGKYLAGFVMSLAIFMFAYGMAIATAMTQYDSIFADLLAESLGLTIVAVFAYSATAYCVGSFMRRGSSMVPFIVMTILLPMVTVLAFAYFLDSGTDLDWIFYLPCYLGEAALAILGAPMSASVGMIAIPYMDLTNVGINAAVGVVWGVLFLLLGMYKTIRREM